MMENNKANELVDKYLYDVVRRLPKKQQEDIKQELRTLIEDMIEEREDILEESYDEKISFVLNKLGDPAELAKSYRGGQDSLISGEYYDSYCYILKIVLICTLAGLIISYIVSAIVRVVDSEMAIAGAFGDMINIAMIPMVLVQVFGFITLAYAIMERKQIKVNEIAAQWTLEKLPEIPTKKELVSKTESMVGIVFGALLIIWFVFAPQLMGAWIQRGDSITSTPIFNLSIWGKVLPLFIICIMCGMVDNFVKFIIGRYTYTLMTVTIISDVLSFVLSFVIFKYFPIWNPNFIPEIQNALDKKVWTNVIYNFNETDLLSNVFLLFLLFCFALDIGTTVYYTVRYGNK